jgi:hypothetical protein
MLEMMSIRQAVDRISSGNSETPDRTLGESRGNDTMIVAKPGERKLRFPENPPKNASYSTMPRSEWQNMVWAELRPLLSSHKWTIRRAVPLYMGDYMVQIYLDNWTLHFQVSVDGKEFTNERLYGDLSGKALIAFDVEGGNRGISAADLKPLYEEIRTALRSNNVYAELGLPEGDSREHLVMETLDRNDVEAISKRMVEYMDVIYNIAGPILERLQENLALTAAPALAGE